jgi:hypothetical protein
LFVWNVPWFLKRRDEHLILTLAGSGLQSGNLLRSHLKISISPLLTQARANNRFVFGAQTKANCDFE